MQVWEIMKDENNDPNQKVIINRPASDSPTEPMVKTIYEGKLKNIPPEIAMKTVMETGWSVGSSCASIRVRPQEDPEEMERQIREACAADPKLAKICESFLAASEYGQKMAAARLINELID